MKNSGFDFARLMRDINLALRLSFNDPRDARNPTYLVIDIERSRAFLSWHGKVAGLDNYPVLDYIYRNRKGKWQVYSDGVNQLIARYVERKVA